MTEDKIDASPVIETKSWKLNFFWLFLLVDGIFIFLRQAIDPLAASSNLTSLANNVAVITAFTGLYLAAFVIGMVLALVYGLLVKEVGKKYRSITWMRALVFSAFPAAFLLYIAWWGRYHAVVN